MLTNLFVLLISQYIWMSNHHILYYTLNQNGIHRACVWRALECSSFPLRVSLVAQRVKRLPAMQETWIRSLGGEDPWRRQWQPTPVFLPGESHEWRSLVGCSPWGRKESDTTELLHFHFSLSCIGEGNGNPLQCSCLENPRDRRAW